MPDPPPETARFPKHLETYRALHLHRGKILWTVPALLAAVALWGAWTMWSQARAEAAAKRLPRAGPHTVTSAPLHLAAPGYRTTQYINVGDSGWCEYDLNADGSVVASPRDTQFQGMRLWLNDRDVGPLHLAFNINPFRPGTSEPCWVEPVAHNRSRLAIDGEFYGPYDDIPTIAWSREGRRFGYAYRRGEKTFLVVDGEQVAVHDGIEHLAFSADGHAYSYEFMDGTVRNVWFDGKVQPREVRHVAFAPVGCIPIIGTERTDGYHVSIDGADYGPGSSTWVLEAKFSRDGKSCAFQEFESQSSHRAAVVLNGARISPMCELADYQLSQDGTVLLYARRDPFEYFVVSGGETRSTTVADKLPDLIPPLTYFDEPIIGWIFAGKCRMRPPQLLWTHPRLLYNADLSEVGWCEARDGKVWFRVESTK